MTVTGFKLPVATDPSPLPADEPTVTMTKIRFKFLVANLNHLPMSAQDYRRLRSAPARSRSLARQPGSEGHGPAYQ